MINKINTLLCYFQINNPIKIEFLQPKNYLTVSFAQTYLQSNPYFHKIHLLLKLPDPVKRPILYRIFHKEIPLRIRTDEQNLWDKKGIVIKQNKRPRSHDVLNENGNVMIRNSRHLIPTNEKFTEKFSYDNIIPPINKLPERVAPRKLPIRENP